MMIDKLHSLLETNKFKKITDIEEINLLGLLFYKTEEKNVFIYIIKSKKFEDIEEISFRLREILKHRKINVWNSYFVLCVESDSFNEEIMLIERDNKYFKKYVVKEDLDFERIYFLNKKTKTSSSHNQQDISTSGEILMLMNKMKDAEGYIRKIKPKEVEAIVKDILKEVGELNED